MCFFICLSISFVTIWYFYSCDLYLHRYLLMIVPCLSFCFCFCFCVSLVVGNSLRKVLSSGVLDKMEKAMMMLVRKSAAGVVDQA